jgi:hypothetical protein
VVFDPSSKGATAFVDFAKEMVRRLIVPTLAPTAEPMV